METSIILVVIIVVFVAWGLYKQKKEERQEKKREELTASGVLNPYRQFMADTVPALLGDYSVLSDAYLTRFSDQFLRDGSTANFTDADLVSGVEPGRASWALHHCIFIASQRFNQSRQLRDAAEAGFDVELKVQRANPNCSQVPSEQVFNPSKAPVYPCADCKEDQPCDIWYKLLT